MKGAMDPKQNANMRERQDFPSDQHYQISDTNLLCSDSPGCGSKYCIIRSQLSRNVHTLEEDSNVTVDFHFFEACPPCTL